MTKHADITFQNNIFSLQGDLNFSNVMSVFQKSLEHLHHNTAEFTFDFAQLTNSNSAGLAFIIEWVKLAKQRNKPIRFKSLSDELLAIAKMSGLDKVINSR